MHAGVLEQACGKSGFCAATREQSVLEAPCEALLERFSRAELEELDSEGRCVVTDHGGVSTLFPRTPLSQDGALGSDLGGRGRGF